MDWSANIVIAAEKAIHVTGAFHRIKFFFSRILTQLYTYSKCTFDIQNNVSMSCVVVAMEVHLVTRNEKQRRICLSFGFYNGSKPFQKMRRGKKSIYPNQ